MQKKLGREGCCISPTFHYLSLERITNISWSSWSDFIFSPLSFSPCVFHTKMTKAIYTNLFISRIIYMLCVAFILEKCVLKVLSWIAKNLSSSYKLLEHRTQYLTDKGCLHCYIRYNRDFIMKGDTNNTPFDWWMYTNTFLCLFKFLWNIFISAAVFCFER